MSTYPVATATATATASASSSASAAGEGGIPKYLPQQVLGLEIVVLGGLQLVVGYYLGCFTLHDMTLTRGIVTSLYLFFIAWGLHVGNTVCLEIVYDETALINPSLRQRYPGKIFIAHNAICVVHVLVMGPIFLAHGMRGWYWSSLVAMLFASMPVVPYNYNTESFGKWVGTFVVFRNLFEMVVTLLLASYDDTSWKLLSVYHYWIWGYRLLDVGPRRLMRASKWKSRNTWIVLVIIYVVVFIVLWQDMVIFAGTDPCHITNNDATAKVVVDDVTTACLSQKRESVISVGGRILYCAVVYLGFFALQKKHVTEVANTEGKFIIHPTAPTYEEYRNNNYTRIE